MRHPKFRCGTREAIEKLARDLELQNEPWMQDWPYEVTNPEDVEKYIEHYHLLSDDDEKFVLMEGIIQAVNDQAEEKDFLKYWNRIKHMLNADFEIHEYTIFHWSCLDHQDLEDTWTITPQMREFWNSRPC